MIYGYARVSTTEQNVDRQVVALDVEKMFIDKISGAKAKRPALDELLSVIKKGDVIVCHAVDRLTRSTLHFCQLVEVLKEKGVVLKFTNGMTLDPQNPDPMQTAYYQMAAIFAELERGFIVKRTKEGMQAAKARGVKLGKKPMEHINRLAIIAECEAGATMRAVAAKYGISAAKVCQIVNH